MSQKRSFLRIIIPILIVGIGAAIMMMLISTRPEPKQEKKTILGALVDVHILSKEDTSVMISGTGTVEPSQQITVVPQVSGLIVNVSPKFKAGGFFSKGETIFSIEDTDYLLALQKAEAGRTKAEYDVATIQSQAAVARQEWDILNKDTGIEPNPLVLFEPQLKNAESALNSAKAAVTQAEVNLSRTVIKAPFNCRVRSKNIDIGQYVKSGDRVAEFAGTDSAEIMVAIPQHELQWMSIPGSHATISLETGSELSTWTGRIVRSTGEVDPGTRMISVVIEVNDPYTLSSSRAGSLNLAAGSFVHVNIKGTELKDIYRIPRIALRDDNTVWLMDQDNKLKIKSVKVLRREKEDILVRNSLTDGEKIVLTNISGAANGMKLRDLN